MARAFAVLRALTLLALPLALAPAAGASAAVHTGVKPAAGVLQAQRALRQSLGVQGVVRLDAHTGRPAVVARLNGFLTGPSRRDPAAIVLAYVRAHRALFGLSDADLARLRPVRRTRSSDGVTHLQWAQTYGGIPALDSVLQANVTRSGRLLNVQGSPQPGLAVPSTTPALSATQALGAARNAVGAGMAPPRASAPAGARRTTTFAGGDRAALVLANETAAPGGAALAWRVLVRKSSAAIYDVVVDASSGRVLRHRDIVDFANALVWPDNPGTPAASTTFPSGWLNGGATTLNGPNAHTIADTSDVVGGPGDALPAGGEIAASGGNWAFAQSPYTYATGNCPASGCSWKHTLGNSWQTNLAQDAAQVFYYVNTFHDHLAQAPINFTTADHNFQGADPVIAQVDDGAATRTSAGLPDSNHLDNANMATYPDGTPGYMQMYLFQPPFAAVDGGDDATIVYHEYTHGLSNRLITDADGWGALDSAQSGAMGEAWSDWYALDFLAEQGRVTDDPNTPGDVRVGGYVDNGQNLIRTQPLDCPVGPATTACPHGGYTYGDFGHVGSSGPEVHDDGEIWGETLWQLREQLITVHGAAEGTRRAEQLITDAMRLSPPEPSYLDERNAILQADAVDSAAEQRDSDNALIWSVFASRGMGYDASTFGSSDVSPVEDFSLPPAAGSPTGSVAGTVTDGETGAALSGVHVAIGGHDTTAGTAGAFAADTDGSGTYSISGVPAQRFPQLIASRTGYDRGVAALTVAAGANTQNFVLHRNWASSAGGATPASSAPGYVGCDAAAAVDQNQGTAWSTDVATGGQQFTVTLPQPVDVSAFVVDPGAGCGDADGSSTGGYRIEVATSSSGFSSARWGTFTAANNHKLNALAPMASALAVTAIRFTALAPQDSTSSYVDLSELGVYGTPATPTVTTSAVSTLATTTATLRGSVNPNAAATTYWFQYGTTIAYGSSTPTRSLTPGTAASNVSEALSGLQPATTYHFRLVAESANGARATADSTFRTSASTVISPTVDPVTIAPAPDPEPATPTATTTPVLGDTSAPSVSLSTPSRPRAATVAGKGVPVTVKCGEACSLVATLDASRTVARRLHLRASRTGTVLARASAGRAAGQRRLVLRLSRSLARRVRAQRTLTLTIRVKATDESGNARTVTRTLRLRR